MLMNMEQGMKMAWVCWSTCLH